MKIQTATPRLSSLALIVGALLAFPAPSPAQAWDGFPPLPRGERAAIATALDDGSFDALRECLAGFQPLSGAEFYAAVVEVTDPGGSASPTGADATAYADALAADWLARGQLDPEGHVLMVLGLANRTVAVRPGDLWAGLGFEGGEVAGAIAASDFRTLAAEGYPAEALCTLARDLDQRLVSLIENPQPAASAPPPPRRAEPEPKSGGGPSAFFWILLLGAVAAGFFFQTRRRRRARSRAESELERWRERLSVGAERLLELEREHPLYFATGALRWSGESQTLDQSTADAVNQLYLIYSEAYNLSGQAQRELESAGRGFSFSGAKYDKVFELLRETEIRFETGEAETQRRIFLPLGREYRNTAANLLDDLDTAYREASEELDQVAEIDERRYALAQEVDTQAAAAVAETAKRAELGLATGHLDELLEPLLARKDEVRETLGTDPVAAIRALEELAQALPKVRDRAWLGNGLVERLRGQLAERGRALREKVESLRAEGLKLDEPGFQPDVRLDRGVREAQKVEELLAGGEEEKAAGLAAELGRALDELEEQLGAIERARGEVLANLSEIEEVVGQLRARIPAARSTLERLEREHAPEAFREAADNLDELAEVLADVDEWREHILEDHREERYLSALADLEECQELVVAGRELLDEIDRAEAELEAARERARELAEEVGREADDLESRAGTEGVGAELQRRVTDALAIARGALEAARVERPDWPELEAALGGQTRELEATKAALEAELGAHERARELARELESELAKLRREVDTERRDRPQVERALADAESGFESWRQALESEEALGGRELLRRGEEAASTARWARELWRGEMDAVEAAESELRAAQAQIERADGRGYGYGVIANCAEARRALGDAQRLRNERRWEDVLSSAREARRLAEAEVARAEREARELEEEERRRRAQRRAMEESRRRRTSPIAQNVAIEALSQLAGAAARSKSYRGSASSFGSRPRRAPSPSRGGRSGGLSFGGGGSRGKRSGGISW